MLVYTIHVFTVAFHASSHRAGQGRTSQRSFLFSLSQYPSDALPIPGLSNGDLVLKGVNADDDGLYQCTVANHVGYSVCVVEVKVSGRYSSPKNPLAWGRKRAGSGLDCRYLSSISESQLVALPPRSGKVFV